MRLLMSLIGVLGMFVFALSGTQAHHAFSGEFDSTKPINYYDIHLDLYVFLDSRRRNQVDSMASWSHRPYAVQFLSGLCGKEKYTVSSRMANCYARIFDAG